MVKLDDHGAIAGVGEVAGVESVTAPKDGYGCPIPELSEPLDGLEVREIEEEKRIICNLECPMRNREIA